MKLHVAELPHFAMLPCCAKSQPPGIPAQSFHARGIALTARMSAAISAVEVCCMAAACPPVACKGTAANAIPWTGIASISNQKRAFRRTAHMGSL